MAIPNLIVLLLLSPQIVALTRQYFAGDDEEAETDSEELALAVQAEKD